MTPRESLEAAGWKARYPEAEARWFSPDIRDSATYSQKEALAQLARDEAKNEGRGEVAGLEQKKAARADSVFFPPPLSNERPSELSIGDEAKGGRRPEGDNSDQNGVEQPSNQSVRSDVNEAKETSDGDDGSSSAHLDGDDRTSPLDTVVPDKAAPVATSVSATVTDLEVGEFLAQNCYYPVPHWPEGFAAFKKLLTQLQGASSSSAAPLYGQPRSRILAAMKCLNIDEALTKWEAAEAKCAELQGWKESQIACTPDYQEIGKLLGVRLGESVHDKIIPGILALRDSRDRLQEALRAVVAELEAHDLGGEVWINARAALGDPPEQKGGAH